ncbi:MAG: histidine phosphatase family protein [Candidatus Eremiobacteraeota bacterium]|nr:histidine phosphatase family protein [Candidatus Eremiobacteraeota bacterium]
MTIELTLVRHGVTEWNAQGRFQGLTDLPLTAEGRAQAALLAAHLSDRRFERVYSSDLRRAMETARAIAAPHGLEPVPDVRLREFGFGSWEGLTWAEILAHNPHLSEMSHRAAHLYEPEGGERFAAVCERARAFYEDVAATGLRRVAVVTHAGVLHATLHAFGLTPAEGRVNFLPASVTGVAAAGGVHRLLCLSDVTHLARQAPSP